MNKHTSGPWRADGKWIKSGKRIIAEAFLLPEPMLPQDANARLIAAAPNMLALLKSVLPVMEVRAPDLNELNALVRAVISEAE